MLKVNSDDVAEAKKAMKSMHKAVSAVADMKSSVDVSDVNTGAAAASEDEAALVWLAGAAALADGLEKYAENLGHACDDLTGDIRSKRADVAGKLRGSVPNPAHVTYDDSASVDQVVGSLDGEFASFGASVNSAWSYAGGLNNDGGEASSIIQELTGLGQALSGQQSAVDDAKTAWDNYANAVQEFDDKYKDLFSRTIVGDIPDWSKKLPGEFGEKLSKFVSDLMIYSADRKKIKELRNPKKMLETFEEEFKDFLPYQTYLKKYRVGVKGHESGRKVCNDFNEVVDDWKNGKKHRWEEHAKHPGKHSNVGKPKGFLENSKELGSVGKGVKMFSKGLGVASKAIDVYTVGSKGVSAFMNTHGTFGQKLGAGFKASGRESVKVGVSTAVTAIVTTAVGVGLAFTPVGPFVAAAVGFAASIGASYGGDWVGEEIGSAIFGRG